MTESEIKAVLAQKGAVAVFAETPDYLVLLKSAGIPSAPLKGGMRSAFEVAADTYPEICSVTGKNASEGGLIHRIDNDTAGLLLIARTQRFYDLAQAAQKANGFVKTYTAYCTPQALKAKAASSGAAAFISGVAHESEPRFTAADLPYTIESRFRPLGEKGAMVKPVFEGGATRADLKKAGSTVYRTAVLALEPVAPAALKADAALSAQSASKVDTALSAKSSDKSSICFYRARCSITAGFRHQVRSHLAATGYPVIGDALYGDGAEKADRMLFFATGLELKEAGLSVCLPDDVLDQMAGEE